MAKKPRIGLDWVTIKYKDIYTIAAIVLGIVVLIASLWIWWRTSGNPRVRAERAIARAQKALDMTDLASAKPDVKAAVSQCRTMLGQAKTEFGAGRFPKAIQIAQEIMDTLDSAQTASPTSQKYAVLVGREGSVEVKRIGQHLFSNATEQMILEDGDIVRTGTNSYARIKYHNLTYQLIPPDSLMVIQALSTTPEGGNHIEVAVKQGGVETQTPENMGAKDETIITTDTARVKPSAASRVSVNQGPTGQVTTSIYQGTSEIESAGKKETFQAGEGGVAVLTTLEGFATTDVLIPPPAATRPKDQQIIRVDDPTRHPLQFEWTGGGTSAARFQISAKPLFSTLLAEDQIVSAGKITIDGLPAGTYYWRLRSQGDDRKTYWSPIYRFRLQQIYQRPKIQRTLKLSVEATPIGDGVIIQGTTDPGVSVSVNDLEVPVNTDGSFSKILLFGEVGSHVVMVRAFDDEGNESTWRKQFRPASY
jgi:hypothetical protein